MFVILVLGVCNLFFLCYEKMHFAQTYSNYFQLQKNQNKPNNKKKQHTGPQPKQQVQPRKQNQNPRSHHTPKYNLIQSKSVAKKFKKKASPKTKRSSPKGIQYFLSLLLFSLIINLASSSSQFGVVITFMQMLLPNVSTESGLLSTIASNYYFVDALFC